MKIKLFNREAISDGYYSNGMARYRRENNKELEVRVNEFMLRQQSKTKLIE